MRTVDFRCVLSWSLCFSMTVAPVAAPAFAGDLPTGGHVAAGSATISAPATGRLAIEQSSQNAIINWQGFSIGHGNAVDFANGSGATLNRVTGDDLSAIHGRLSATGSVFLVNRNGVLVGKDGVIETGGGFVASTLDVTDADFMDGGDLTFRGSSDASVVNLGRVAALGGDVAFIARSIVNDGTISAANGMAGLAAGREVLLRDGALQDGKLVVKVGDADDRIEEKGLIEAASAELRANGGHIYALAGNKGGAVRATGVSRSGGRVFLTAGGGSVTVAKPVRAARVTEGGKAGGDIVIDAGSVTVAGHLDASGTGGAGGTIDLGAERSIVLRGAVLDASGTVGGRVRLGGELQGGRGLGTDEVRNTDTLSVDAASRIDVRGSAGMGGTAILWSETETRFSGHIAAAGARSGLMGGFVEVSSYGALGFAGTVDTGGGTLLLDPTDIEIGSSQTTSAASFIDVSTIAAALGSNNVVITTHDAGRADDGHIYVTAALSYDSAYDLSLLAHGDIAFGASLQNSGAGAVNLVAGWDGASGLTGTLTGGRQTDLAFDNAAFAGANLASQSLFGNGGGSVIIGDGTQTAGIAVGTRSGATRVYASDLRLAGSNTTAGGYAQLGYQVPHPTAYTIAGAGITVRAAGNVSATAGSAADGYVRIGHGGRSTVAVASGSRIDAPITVEAVGDVLFSAGSGRRSSAQLGHGGYGAAGDYRGDVTIVGANNVSFTGGRGNGAFALLGHGGHYADGAHSGDIAVTLANDLTFTAGLGPGASAQIGHGGYDADGDHSGAITISAGNNIRFKAGNYFAYAQLGHGGYNSGGNQNGDITITSVNDLTFLGGTFFAYAQLGHGGAASWTGQSVGNRSGNISITAANDITFEGGGRTSDAQLGHGGIHSDGDNSGAISILSAKDIYLTAKDQASAQLGHGGFSSDGNHSGDITIASAKNLSLKGGGFLAYALLGHGDALHGHNAQGGGTRQGLISLQLSGELSVESGSNPASNYNSAWIGHATRDTDAISNADMTITAAAMDASVSTTIASGGQSRLRSDIVTNALSGGNLTVTLTGSGASFTDAIAVATGHGLIVNAANDIVLDSGFSFVNSSNGNVVLAAGGNFHNDTGSTTPIATAGRWLVYSTRPDNNRNDIEITNRDFLRYDTAFDAGDPIPSGFATGNGLIYTVKPVLTVTAANQAITYGETIDTSAFSVGGLSVSGIAVDAAAFGIDLSAITINLGLSDAVSVSAAGYAEAGTWIGGIAASGSGSWSGIGTATQGGTLTVAKAALTVTAGNDSKTYDGLGYTDGNGVSYAGFVSGEDESVLSGALAYGGTAKGAVGAGSYAITPEGLSSGNYNITYVDGTLTVAKAALTVTAADDRKTYDGLAYSGGAGVSYAGFVNGEDETVLSGALSYGGDSQGAINAGSYVIAPDGWSSDNYDISYVDGTLTVDRAALTIKALDDVKVYDGVAYTGGNGVSYAGFANGEDQSVLSGTLTYGGTAQGAVEVGTYAITAGGLSSDNYTITWLDGDLMVTEWQMQPANGSPPPNGDETTTTEPRAPVCESDGACFDVSAMNN